MPRYYATISCLTYSTVKVDMPDGVEPTEQDVWEASRYVDNHGDSVIMDETVISIEKE